MTNSIGVVEYDAFALSIKFPECGALLTSFCMAMWSGQSLKCLPSWSTMSAAEVNISTVCMKRVRKWELPWWEALEWSDDCMHEGWTRVKLHSHLHGWKKVGESPLYHSSLESIKRVLQHQRIHSNLLAHFVSTISVQVLDFTTKFPFMAYTQSLYASSKALFYRKYDDLYNGPVHCSKLVYLIQSRGWNSTGHRSNSDFTFFTEFGMMKP